MKKKKQVLSEIIGVFVVIAGAVFLQNIYELSGKSTISVVFGSVNMSVWEKSKGISIPYVLYALIELMSIKPSFRRFVVSKVSGLAVSLAVFLIADSFFSGNTSADRAILVVAVLCGFLCSCVMYYSKLCLNPFFAPACFLLMLIFMMTFSFTAFPPKLALFRDPLTGCYGVLPQSFDMGAVALTF